MQVTASEGEVTLPIGPLGLALPSMPYMAAVELLRDRILDHFEASGGLPLPMAVLRDTLRGLPTPESFWGELPQQGLVSLEDFSDMLLLWLRPVTQRSYDLALESYTCP